MGNSNVEQRKFTFCPTIAGYPLDRLIVQCSDCERFFAACCPDDSFGGDWFEEDQKTCHHFQLVFTDGACLSNGLINARAGLGITMGGDDECSFSIPVDEATDPGAPRTNQRAELLAAIEGLKKLHRLNLDRGHHEKSKGHKAGSTYVIVTDSKYVVKGITEWFPSWRRRGWRTADGKRPSNLDLFLKLDEDITALEQEHVAVGFWHVPRAYNHKADALAKRAANV